MSEIDLDYVEDVIIPEAEKKLRKYKEKYGHSSIWGEKLEMDPCDKWTYLRGTGKTCMGKGYIYLKINNLDQQLYSPSGKKGLCHYMDKDSWSKTSYFKN